jgi:hypothetical protein
MCKGILRLLSRGPLNNLLEEDKPRFPKTVVFLLPTIPENVFVVPVPVMLEDRLIF